jgi:L-ribulokinase
MSTIVAGVDFGTLSVRVSLFDSERGRLGFGTAEYPLHRKNEDPDYATQSHADHMEALVLATRKALQLGGMPRIIAPIPQVERDSGRQDCSTG